MSRHAPPAIQHRWLLGGLADVLGCPACGSQNRGPNPYRIRDYLGTGSTDEWQLWRCLRCSSIFLDPRPDDASVALAYQSYYTHQLPGVETRPGRLVRVAWGLFNSYLGDRFQWQRRPRIALGRWLCEAIPPLSLKLDYFCRHLFRKRFPDKGLLLDIGCGNGEFLVQAASMGWQVLGIEPDNEAVAACAAQGLNVVHGTVDAVPATWLGQVDVVTLSHCIEHVIDPGHLLAGVARILRPGGWIWIATPNPGGFGLKLFGRFWRGLEPSRHLCIPSQTQLHNMLLDAGFEAVQPVRRGAHGKTITRESALIARLDRAAGGGAPALLQWLGLPVRLAASIAGSVSAKWGEETVMIARVAETKVID